MSKTYPPINIPGTEVRTLHSDQVGEDYKLFIYLPFEYAKSDESYPVLYALDGNWNRFRYFWSLPDAPPVIVVGIGYDTNDWGEQIRTRFRDYHPTIDSKTLPEMREFFKIETLGGGGEQFLSFIREELMPFINNEYQTIPDDRAFLGHSSGGYFGLYTMFHRTDTFNRYIIIAPPLYWDNEIMFDYEHGYAQKHSDLHVRLYLGVGTEDESLELPAVSNLMRFHTILKSRNHEGLDMKLDLISGESHKSSIIPAGQRGMIAVFS